MKSIVFLISPHKITHALTGIVLGILTLTMPCVGDPTTHRKDGTDVAITPVVAEHPENSFWSQPYMLGDWGGERTRLANEGIIFCLNNIGDLQSDVTGSQTHHVTYDGRFRGIVDINFKKLSDVDGEFFFTGLWQYGRNNTAQYPAG